jgi:hypothetical protein
MKLFTLLLRRIFFLSLGEFDVNVLDDAEYAEQFEVDLRTVGISAAEYGDDAEHDWDDEGADPNRYRSEDESSSEDELELEEDDEDEDDDDDVDPASGEEDGGGGGGGRSEALIKRREELERRKKVRRIIKLASVIHTTAQPDDGQAQLNQITIDEDNLQHKATYAFASYKWFFDMDTITSHFLTYAYEYDMSPPPKPVPKQVNLAPFRAWLFARVKSLKEEEVKAYRRIWYDDLITTESYVRIHQRKNPMDTKPASRAIIINKNDELHVVHCNSKEAVLDEQATGLMLRMNTDAMFFMQARALSTSGGNIALAVYRKSFQHVDGPLCIYRDPIRNLWIVHFSDQNERFSATSFTAAFAFMRQRMKEKDVSHMKDTCDLSVWDKYLLPPESTSGGKRNSSSSGSGGATSTSASTTAQPSSSKKRQKRG